MARPMILIERDMLTGLYDENLLGVPYAVLVRVHKLQMTAPTLSKLLEYFDTYNTVPDALREQIGNSLFPEWLTEVEQKQPPDWFYVGVMPHGKWERRQ